MQINTISKSILLRTVYTALALAGLVTLLFFTSTASYISGSRTTLTSDPLKIINDEFLWATLDIVLLLVLVINKNGLPTVKEKTGDPNGRVAGINPVVPPGYEC